MSSLQHYDKHAELLLITQIWWFTCNY